MLTLALHTAWIRGGSPRSAFVVLAAFLLTFLAPLGAIAQEDLVEGMRSEDLSEVEHRVRISMYPGYAKLVVERTVFNPSDEHDQATFDIYLPSGAVATGLRTLGTKDGRPHWYDGELLEAEEAARKYRELTGIGGYYPKDPALLSWRSQDHLKLQVFPCPPRERKSVEYTLLVPTTYEGGAHALSLSRMGTAELPAQVELEPQQRKGRILGDDGPLQGGSKLVPSADERFHLRYFEDKPRDIALELGTANTGAGRMVQHVDVRIGVLSTVPEQLDVVVVIDRSLSVGNTTREGIVRSLRAYLRAAPRAQTTIVSFGRTARVEGSIFSSAKQAEVQLGSLELEAENGSNLEAALALASDLLETRAKNRARRIVIVTDGLTNSRITPVRLRGLTMKSGALIHLALTDGLGDARLEPDRESAYGQAIEPTGGLVWSAKLPDRETIGPNEERIFEEWMRPKRLLDVRIGLNTESPLIEGATLWEGESYTDFRLADESKEGLYMKGRLWAKSISRAASAGEELGDVWAALAFGADIQSELTEPEMFVLARRGHAVSPVTSYLAIEPGVRPSTEGIDWEAGFGIGLGHIGGLPRVRMGATSYGSLKDPEGFLQRLVKKHWERCGGRGAAGVDFETTYSEIVSVANVSGMEDNDEVAEKCLEEALWQEKLPTGFSDRFAAYAVVAH